jgi:hypothetical protein
LKEKPKEYRDNPLKKPGTWVKEGKITFNLSEFSEESDLHDDGRGPF